MIEFFCPNGHPLSSAADLAGKPGQCPRCQATFVVPKGHAGSEDEQIVSATPQILHADKPVQDANPEEGEKFMFLCPNGHKLHGSFNLQGRPGQCPHCNARFLIPHSDDVREPDDGGESDFAEAATDDDQHGGVADGGVTMATAERVVINIHDEPPPPPMPVSCHPLAQIIRKLWAETRGAGVLELRLDSDEILLAESFSAELSQHEFGVFAVRGENMTQAVTIVPWDSINQATLRNLADLPSELFRSSPPSRRRQDRPR